MTDEQLADKLVDNAKALAERGYTGKRLHTFRKTSDKIRVEVSYSKCSHYKWAITVKSIGQLECISRLLQEGNGFSSLRRMIMETINKFREVAILEVLNR